MIRALIVSIFVVTASAVCFAFLHMQHMHLVDEKKERIQNKFKKVSQMFAVGSALQKEFVANADENAERTRNQLANHLQTDLHFNDSEKKVLFDSVEKNRVDMNDVKEFSAAAKALSNQTKMLDKNAKALERTKEKVSHITHGYVDGLRHGEQLTKSEKEMDATLSDIARLDKDLLQVRTGFAATNGELDKMETRINNIGTYLPGSLEAHADRAELHYTMETALAQADTIMGNTNDFGYESNIVEQETFGSMMAG